MPDTLLELDLRPYAGLWIAVVDGRVAGVGRTARAARLAARRNRPKDEPLLLRVADDGQGVRKEDT